MNTQKGFSSLLGILLFIVLVGSGLFLYTEKVSKEIPEVDTVSISIQKEIKKENTIQEKSSFSSLDEQEKIYINKEYGFEFSYPENMEIIKTIYKPDYSLLRIEMSNMNPSSLATDKEGGEEIIIDVINSDTIFTYNQSESVLYSKQSNNLQIIDNETQKNIKTLSSIFQKNNWSGFIDESYENNGSYLGRVYIPSKNKNFIFDIGVSDRNNIENKELANNFWNSFKLLES